MVDPTPAMRRYLDATNSGLRFAPIYDHPTSKLAKETVDYSEGMGETRCGNCRHFLAPDACEIVRGAIDPRYWCNRFAKR